jgi:hypothetical protein
MSPFAVAGIASLAAVALAFASGCSSTTSSDDTQTAASAKAPAAQASGDCNLANFLAVQHAHVNHAEVTLCGDVERLRTARRTRSGVHRFIWIDVGHGDLIEVDANLDEMGDFPVTVGEHAVVRGEYYYDDNGREGIHWTHHTDRGSHPSGYIILNGTTYQ